MTVRARELAAAARRFKGFHARQPQKVGFVNIPHPKALVFLGHGVAIEYRSDKLALGSRKMRTYRHRFGGAVKIFTDAKGKTLYITGGRFRVTDWMRD
jgi:hypothetical protein